MQAPQRAGISVRQGSCERLSYDPTLLGAMRAVSSTVGCLAALGEALAIAKAEGSTLRTHARSGTFLTRRFIPMLSGTRSRRSMAFVPATASIVFHWTCKPYLSRKSTARRDFHLEGSAQSL
jgi:hypothetical protein